MDVAFAVEFLALSEMDRQIIGPAALYILSHVGPQEEALVEKDARIALLAVGSGTFGMEMMEMEVAHISGIRPAAEGLDEAMRNAGNAGKMYVAAAFDMAYGFVGAYVGYRLHMSVFYLTKIGIF